MPLPILQGARAAGREDLLRLFHRTELHWTRHLGEEVVLAGGVAFTNADLPRVWDANRVLDGVVPEGASAAEVMGEIDAHFAAVGLACAQWTMNPSALPQRTEPLVSRLTAAGWSPAQADVLHLTAAAPSATATRARGLTIIPARASFRHARQIAEDAAHAWNEPQLTEAAMLHLDDPHYDSLLALSQGNAVGRVGVLAVGDIGRIDHLYVPPSSRRQGIGRILMDRAMEICARSLFRHVLLAVDPANHAAQALYASLGFQKIGQIVSYRLNH